MHSWKIRRCLCHEYSRWANLILQLFCQEYAVCRISECQALNIGRKNKGGGE